MDTSPTAIAAQTHATSRRGRLRPTIGYFWTFAMLGLAGAVLGPTLPGLAAQTSVALGAASVLFSARAVGGFIGSLLAGQLYDRLPGHPLILANLAISAVLLAVIPLLPTLWMLVAVMLLVGISGGLLMVGTNTLLGWVQADRIGPYMNGLHFFFGAGAFVSPLIVAQVLRLNGEVVLTYRVLAVLHLPLLAWFIRLPSPGQASTVGDDNDGQSNYMLLLLVAAFFALYAGAEVGFGGWVFSYAQALELASATTAAYLTSVFYGVFTLGRLLAVPLANRLRPRTILLADLVGALLSIGAILLWSGSKAVLWAGTVGIGVTLAAIFPTTVALTERRMRLSGRATSRFFLGASVGVMSLPWLMGQLFETVGPRATMITIFLDLWVALGVLLFLLRRFELRRSLQDA